MSNYWKSYWILYVAKWKIMSFYMLQHVDFSSVEIISSVSNKCTVQFKKEVCTSLILLNNLSIVCELECKRSLSSLNK